MTKILVMFECSAEVFGPVMTSMAPHMNAIEGLRIESREENKKIIAHRKTVDIDQPRPGRRANSVETSKVQMLILKLMYDRLIKSNLIITTNKQMSDALKSAGFAPKSFSPARTYLSRDEGLITINSNKNASLTETGIEFCKKHFGESNETGS